MTLTPALKFAILSMDSYNRGYSSGVEFTGSQNPMNATAVDTLTIISQEKLNEWIAAGFYAQAYQENGVTIISYRGTDKYLADGATGGDIWNGCMHCN